MSTITINQHAEYLIRQNRRVYFYLHKVAEDNSIFCEGFKDGGDNFLSPFVLTNPQGINVFATLHNILGSRYPDVKVKLTDEEITDAKRTASLFSLDYKFDVRSKNLDEKRNKKNQGVLFTPVFRSEPTNEEIENTMLSYSELKKLVDAILEQKINADSIEYEYFQRKVAPDVINNKTYFTLVEYLFGIIRLADNSANESDPIDWNSNEFVNTDLTIHEIKLALHFLGVKSMSVVDVNKDLTHKVGVCSNQLWLIYLLNCIGTVAYNLPYSAVPVFIQAVNDSATGAQFVSAYQWAFSLVQAFGVVVWHRVADKIGRKSVFILVFLVYFVTNIITALFNTKIIKPTDINELNNGMLLGWLHIVIRIVQGFFGLTTPMSISAVNDLAPPSIRARALGANGTIVTVASFICNIIIAFGIENIPWVKLTKNKENSMIICSAVAAGLYLINVALSVFILKETSATIKAKVAGQKLGVEIKKDEDAVKTDPFKKCIVYFVKNKNLVIIFFAYLTLLGSTLVVSSTTSMFIQSYVDSIYVNLLTDANIVGAIGCGIAVIIMLFCLKPMIKRLGEVKTTVVICVLNMPNIIYRTSPPPVSRWGWGVLGSGNALAVLACEACLMALAGNETTPQNRGTISGIMQVANSLGRVVFVLIWNSWFTINYRDSQYSTMMITAVTLFLLSFLNKVVLAKDVNVLREKQLEKKRVEMAA